MALNIPDSLANLEANCGLFAVWMVLQHHGVQIDVAELIKVCRYDDEGTYTIALAVALKKLGFEVSFHSDHDPNISSNERMSYKEAKILKIPTGPALSYQDIQIETQNGKMVIVYYDTLEGIGNQSLIYSIDQNEICFFDSFDPMSAAVFEKQRQVEGICRQAIVIDDRNFQIHLSKMN
ncbi:cysteine peptidase family C39 domain-containing protein [Acinetobacter baumannii]|uniref:cysteine peptidase family C39 domain-containing protein n=1 Tax=Acinetobacter baumannii TaxID=470 RepID=UPI00044A9690|nr:cysteine peptidase family C39 domain-containing protein [Acinetobacter baumannii]EKU7310386.1 peptidase C39 [Acinetobacter baumannii]EKU7313853.1 peptidase C39 [Acinetobacter baumannii]EXG92818.1 peptidase C39 family protein [Acinetobacter baumannii 1062314]MBJ9418274.1 peptidase C39 [Acinetobacter baumannii]MDC5434206.1 cysteine peptidase family C39 domain-containing protein [Acinetobacter baumannii]